MTPFEVVNTINREVGEYAPKLSAIINKALLFHGEGNLIASPSGKAGGALTLAESETVRVKPQESEFVMLKVMDAAHLVESNSSWRLIVDTRNAGKNGKLDLRYTLIRDKGLM